MKMLLRNNNINYNNIVCKYNDKYDFYNILYDLSYILLKGIPLRIKYSEIVYKNKIVYVYISDPKYLELLYTINKYFKEKCVHFIKKFKNKYYIICNNYKNIIIENDYVDINISKIRKIYNEYVLILNII